MDSMQSSEEKKKVKNPNRQQSFGPSDWVNSSVFVK